MAAAELAGVGCDNRSLARAPQVQVAVLRLEKWWIVEEDMGSLDESVYEQYTSLPRRVQDRIHQPCFRDGFLLKNSFIVEIVFN